MNKYFLLILLILFVAAAPKIAEIDSEGEIIQIETLPITIPLNETINETEINNTEVNETLLVINDTDAGNETEINETLLINDTLPINETQPVNETEELPEETVDELINETNKTSEPPVAGVTESWDPDIPTGAFTPPEIIIFPNPETTLYIRLNGKLIASSKGAITEYYHSDITGTSRITSIDQYNQKEKSYSPYGVQISGVEEDGPGFTGHLLDTQSDLVYAGARYYNPELRIWITPDPIFRSDTSLYSYAENNPINYFDPDGRDIRTAQSELKALGNKVKNKLDSALNSLGTAAKNLGTVGQALFIQGMAQSGAPGMDMAAAQHYGELKRTGMTAENGRIIDDNIGLQGYGEFKITFWDIGPSAKLEASVGTDGADAAAAGTMTARNYKFQAKSDNTQRHELSLFGVGGRYASTDSTETFGVSTPIGFQQYSFEDQGDSLDITETGFVGPNFKLINFEGGPVAIKLQLKVGVETEVTHRHEAPNQ